MDPCPFMRITIDSLAIKLPANSPKPRKTNAGVHPSSSSPYYCTITLPLCPSIPSQTTPIPLFNSPQLTTPLVLGLDEQAIRQFSTKPVGLFISVYSHRTGRFGSDRLLGRVRVSVEPGRMGVVQNGWVSVGPVQLHLVVRSEPDPRFVFQFGGEPECSPVVYQVPGQRGRGFSGCIQQPVFSCRFSVDRRRFSRCQSGAAECNTPKKKTHNIMTTCFGTNKQDEYNRINYHHKHQQRKGWTVTIHDLSGSPVAAASMVTPFVPSPDLNRVSRSNPGAWLILRNINIPRPSTTSTSAPTWKPWGRLEAWRERGGGLGYKFELVDGPNNRVVPFSETSLSVKNGGRFCIEADVIGGFVMASSFEGEGKVSKPTVEVGVKHVARIADAAVFVALAAAIDLSVDACRLFSQKLRKELCFDEQQECW